MKGKNLMESTLILFIFCAFSTFTKAQVNISLNINQPPPLVASAGAGQTICAGGNTFIGDAATGGKEPYAFSWSPSTGLSNATVANPVASPSVTTTYVLTVTDANNCKSTGNIMVTIDPCTGIDNASGTAGMGNFSIVPNPNGGTFSIIFPTALTTSLEIIRVEIYNILGKRVYETFFIPALSIGEQLSPYGGAGGGSGIYLVRISYENATYTEKLIIE